MVVEAHEGLRTQHEVMYNEIKKLLIMDSSDIKVAPEPVAEKTEEMSMLPSKDEIENIIKVSLSDMGKSPRVIKKLKLKNMENIYIMECIGEKGGELLFGKVVSHPPPCDQCHDIQYVYLFEPDGKIIQLIPLQLTKYGNEDFTPEDIDKTRERILGRYLYESFDFDPEVDAVSAATITSMVIFKTIDEGKEIYKILKEEGLAK